MFFPVLVPDFVPAEGAVLPPHPDALLLLLPTPSTALGRQLGWRRPLPLSQVLVLCRLCALGTVLHPACALPHPLLWGRLSAAANGEVGTSPGPRTRTGCSFLPRLFKANKRCNASPSARLPAFRGGCRQNCSRLTTRCAPHAFGTHVFKKKSPHEWVLVKQRGGSWAGGGAGCNSPA